MTFRTVALLKDGSPLRRTYFGASLALILSTTRLEIRPSDLEVMLISFARFVLSETKTSVVDTAEHLTHYSVA